MDSFVTLTTQQAVPAASDTERISIDDTAVYLWVVATLA